MTIFPQSQNVKAKVLRVISSQVLNTNRKKKKKEKDEMTLICAKYLKIETTLRLIGDVFKPNPHFPCE